MQQYRCQTTSRINSLVCERLDVVSPDAFAAKDVLIEYTGLGLLVFSDE